MPTTLILKLLAIAAILAGIWFHFQGDKAIKVELTDAKVRIGVLEEEVSSKNTQIESLTADVAKYVDQSLQATLDRKRTQAALNAALTKLRAQQIPADCQGAVDFAVDHKDELAW